MAEVFYLFSASCWKIYMCCYCVIIPSIHVMVEEVEGELVQGQLSLGVNWDEVWYEDDSRFLDPDTSLDAIQAWLPLKVSWLSVFFRSIFSGPEYILEIFRSMFNKTE